ncbi:MAG: hypothetical protein ARM1_0680 [Candidatus Micrarchaeota archaeon]|nr:MAG: hypothetical protein ARM1_0680 [Candidatus Micrarchaeota archaeon]
MRSKLKSAIDSIASRLRVLNVKSSYKLKKLHIRSTEPGEELRRLYENLYSRFRYDDKITKRLYLALGIDLETGSEASFDLEEASKLIENRKADINHIVKLGRRYYDAFSRVLLIAGSQREDIYLNEEDIKERIEYRIIKRDDFYPNRSIDGTPYLHMAILLKNYLAVKLLLDRGADPNKKDVYGANALHAALSDPHPDIEIVRMLLEHEADPNAEHLDKTALDLISERINKARVLRDSYTDKDIEELLEIQDLLINYGARSKKDILGDSGIRRD